MKILVSALERSANVHLGALRNELPKETILTGIFDATLGEPMADLQSLAIMGIVDAVKKISFFRELGRKMTDLAAEADKVLLMDSSGFNLPLAKKIRKRYPKKEIIYYILPQAWAWRRGRIPVLENTCSKLASILPFEKKFYSANSPIEYVGHPLLDEIKNRKNSLSESVETVAFLPGSRKNEISSLMPVFREIRKSLGIKKAYIVIPPHFEKSDLESIYGDLDGFHIENSTEKTLLKSDFAFICSGTATLEAAIMGTPFILSYKAKALDYFIGSRIVKIEHVGLANIFSKDFQGRTMHPEFLQNSVTAENLLKAFDNYDISNFHHDSKKLVNYLGHGSSARTASLLVGRL